jgi:hypothetical protein
MGRPMPGLDERRAGGAKLWKPQPASKEERKSIKDTEERLKREADEARRKKEATGKE